MVRRWMGWKTPGWFLLAVVGGWGPLPGWAGEGATYRSLGTPRAIAVEPRKQAELGLRASHVGWEFRSEHFVVVSTQSAQQASQTAEHLEQAWNDMAQLADRWTQVHRQPSFGLQAVAVVMASGNRATVGGHASRFLTEPPGTELFVNLAEGSWNETQLRREACGAFLGVAQQDVLLPAWARLGLANYVAGEPTPQITRTDLAPPPHSGKVWTFEEQQRAQLWGHFLLEGNDAQYAPRFLEAVRATIAAHSQALASHALHQPVGAWQPDWDRNSPLATLVAQAVREGQVNAWLREPAMGQPIVCPDPQELTLDARDRELVLILKLARRFAVAGKEAIQPKQTRFVPEAVTTLAEETAPVSEPLWTMEDLRRRLTAPGGPTWATLDIDGRLLFSDDQQRWTALFSPADRRYTTRRGEHGEELLQATYSDGRVVQAWLEANAENPLRPLVYFRKVTPSSPTADLSLERILVR